MTIRSFAIAAMAAAGVLCSAMSADAQWGRASLYNNYRSNYSSYYNPSYGYSYAPGVVYSPYNSVYSTSPSGVVTNTTGVSTSGVYTYPSTGVISSSTGMYNYPYTGMYSYPYNGVYNTNPYSYANPSTTWGYNNLYSGNGYGVGSSGVHIGPWRSRW